MKAKQFPQQLWLPDGWVQLVVGSTLTKSGPLYEYADGRCIHLDTAIPDDLSLYWCWWGVYGLSSVSEVRVTISTVCFPPPGLPGVYTTCFDKAREHQVRESEPVYIQELLFAA